MPKNRRTDPIRSAPSEPTVGLPRSRSPARARYAPYRRELACCVLPGRGLGSYPEWMLDLGEIDVEEVATALADQTDYEHRWLIDPRTGQVAFWTSDTGIDGENPVEIDELDLIPIDPLPSHMWFQDMADFAEGITESAASRQLTQSLQGRGAFRRFKNQIYEHHPELISAWHALRDVRAQRRAVEWLLAQGLIDDSAAQQFATDHPDPGLP